MKGRRDMIQTRNAITAYCYFQFFLTGALYVVPKSIPKFTNSDSNLDSHFELCKKFSFNLGNLQKEVDQKFDLCWKRVEGIQPEGQLSQDPVDQCGRYRGRFLEAAKYEWWPDSNQCYEVPFEECPRHGRGLPYPTKLERPTWAHFDKVPVKGHPWHGGGLPNLSEVTEYHQ